MIKVELLKNHPEAISALAAIWFEVLGRKWASDVPLERIINRFQEHLNDVKLPITFIALDENIPIGMCSLRANDGIRSDLTPWLGSLVVDPKYQNQGIGKRLIEETVVKAKQLGFEKLYLFALDKTIPDFYAKLGWVKIGFDSFKSHPVTVMEYYIQKLEG